MPPAKVIPLPYGVDETYFHPGLMVEKRFQVFSAGIDRGRDYETLKASAARLPDVRFDIFTHAGWDLAPIPPNVTMHPPTNLEQHRHNIANADLVVIPSKNMAYPSGQSVMLESFAAGRPTIVSDTPAIRDYARDGSTATLVPVGDPAGLTQAISDLLGDDERRAALGAQARESVMRGVHLSAHVGGDRHCARRTRLTSWRDGRLDGQPALTMSPPSHDRGATVTVGAALRRIRVPASVRAGGDAVAGAVSRCVSAEQRQQRTTVRRALRLPPVPPRALGGAGGVWAVTMVKDEADIIESTIRHLFTQGVDGVLVSDNGSTDGTAEILERLAREFNVHVAHDREKAYYQATKMSLLAAWARRAGAEWIIPFDADEYWFAPGASLAEWLRAQRADVVRAPIHNQFPTQEGGWALDTQAHLHPKVAFRAHRLAWLAMGNHDVLRPGRRTEGLHVLHLPWRSFDQFARKTRTGAAALAASTLDSGLGSHWRDVGTLAEDELRHLWDDLLCGHDDPALGWTPVGPFHAVDARAWATWDPDGVLLGDVEHPHVARGLDVVYLRPKDSGFGRVAVVAWLAGHYLGDSYRVLPGGDRLATSGRTLVVAPRFEDLAACLRAGWTPSASDAAWVLGGSGKCPDFPGRLFVTPRVTLPPGVDSEMLPLGADVSRTPEPRADRWVDVVGEGEALARLGAAATPDARWRPMSTRRATPWEDQRSLWADLGRAKVAVVSRSDEAPWWPDAVATGTLLTGEVPAEVPAWGRVGSIAEGIAGWSPGLGEELRGWARRELDWRWRLHDIGRVLGIWSPELEAALAELRR